MNDMTQTEIAKKDAGVWTVPNAICAARIAGSALLIYLASLGMSVVSLYLILVLVLSDWVDGKLALWLNQRSKFGARFDSAADACFYAAALSSILLLNPAYILNSMGWVAAGLVAYAVNVAVSLAKFRKMPSYHTRLAKTSWAIAAIAILGGFLGWDHWALQVAASCVIVTNVEQILMSLLLKHYAVDVSCLPEARLMRRNAEENAAELRSR